MTVTDISPHDDWKPPVEPTQAQDDARRFATTRGAGAPRPRPDAERFAYTVHTIPHDVDHWSDPAIAQVGARGVRRAMRRLRAGHPKAALEFMLAALETQARLAGCPVRLPRRPLRGEDQS